MRQFVSILFVVACMVFSLGINAEPDKPILTGTFAGLSGHKASGGFSIYRDEQGYLLRFHQDFMLDGAPDPRLGFGKGKYLPATEFAKLLHTQGAREYRLPLDSKLEQYSDFWIWCEKYSVPIGRVELQ